MLLGESIAVLFIATSSMSRLSQQRCFFLSVATIARKRTRELPQNSRTIMYQVMMMMSIISQIDPRIVIVLLYHTTTCILLIYASMASKSSPSAILATAPNLSEEYLL